jgi:ribosomal protein L35AE/L33A
MNAVKAMHGMTEDEMEFLDAVVIGFENDDCIVSVTGSLGNIDLRELVGRDVFYEDFKGVVWKGRVVDVYEGDNLLVRFQTEAISEGGPSGLGQGSLVKIPSRA